MIGLFKGLFKKNGKEVDDISAVPINDELTDKDREDLKSMGDSYERDSKLVMSPNVQDRLDIASNKDTHKEILFYLAKNDPDVAVRKEVVNNASFPAHVSTHVAVDENDDVRILLAGRLVKLLPELTSDEHSKLYGFVVKAMGILALDQVVIVRRALSSSLKDCAYAPQDVVSKLARDAEREISEPILRFCSALSDDDIIDILSGFNEDWVVEAIAARDKVSTAISEAVIDAEKEVAGKMLIEKHGDEFGEDLLKKIVDKSKTFKGWQSPVAKMKILPISFAKELAEFVGDAVRDILLNRSDYDDDLIDEISEVFKRRVDFMEEKIISDDEPTSDRVARYYNDKLLDDEMVLDAIGSRDIGFVYESLAILSDVAVSRVKEIINMKAPKSIIAIVWKSGLSMRTALQIEKEVARVNANDLIYPRGGTDYPMTEDELNWQLDFLDIK